MSGEDIDKCATIELLIARPALQRIQAILLFGSAGCTAFVDRGGD